MSHFLQTPCCRNELNCVCVVQVVKLLLQYGSNVTDRNLGGLCAVEMAKESNIKELLQASALTQQHNGKAQSSTTAVLQSVQIFSDGITRVF